MDLWSSPRSMGRRRSFAVSKRRRADSKRHFSLEAMQNGEWIYQVGGSERISKNLRDAEA
jgi:hypothetical protein